jgi:hypothetical protein
LAAVTVLLLVFTGQYCVRVIPKFPAQPNPYFVWWTERV